MPTDIADPPIRTKKDEGLWATLTKSHAANTGLQLHQHRAGQLVFAVSGVMLVETPGARWTVPPQRALWIPPLHLHSIQFVSATALRTVYCQPDLLSQCSGFTRQHEVHAVVASPLIKALVLGLFDLQFDHASRLQMVSLLLQALRQTVDLPTRLLTPHSQALREALAPLLQANRWQVPMHQLAGDAAMSERTFSRRFQAEVGMSFRGWRQRARILASLDLLASDAPVKSIAHTLQFESAAAYVAAFRGLLGCTPHAFRTSSREGAEVQALML